MKNYKYYNLLCGIFVASLLISNILSSAKIVYLGEFLGFSLVLDAGTFVFPLCYILGDIFTEVYGYNNGKKIIWAGFFSSIILVVCVYLIGLLPAETLWQESVGDIAYQNILGGIANGGIIIASLSAYLVGEFSNSIILSKMKVLTKGKWFVLRAFISTIIGQFLDSLVFIIIASFFGVFMWEIAFILLISIFIFKVFIEFVLLPITYAIVIVLKKAEQEDAYDFNTKYKIFSIKS